VPAGTLGGVELTRPAPAAEKGPLDDTFYDLVEARFRDRVERDPVSATYLGIHAWDDQLGDPSRDAALEEIESDRHHLAAIEALDTAGLSSEARFERDLELHHLRLSLFNGDVVRSWERHATGASAVGDALFPLFARDHAPLNERLEAIAGRLEGVPAYLAASGTVTKVSSESFGGMADEEATAQLEIRASWTPLGDPVAGFDIGTHVEAWGELLCTASGLPPVPEGVASMPSRRGQRGRG